jgi:CRP-like cAMP-binding protein
MRARLLDGGDDNGAPSSNVLSPKEQDELRSIAKTIVLPRRGMTIFSSGAEAGFVYVIGEGIIRISRVTANGSRRILAFMLPGDLFGMPDCGIYLNSADSVTPAMLYRFSWPALREAMAKDPQLQLSFLTKLAHDFRQAQRQLMMLGQQSAHQRLALFLLDFMRSSGLFDRETSLLRLPVTRFDLADFLGTTRETTARAFAKLQDLGLIERVNAQAIRIADVKGLQQLQFGPCRRPPNWRVHLAAVEHESAVPT